MLVNEVRCIGATADRLNIVRGESYSAMIRLPSNVLVFCFLFRSVGRSVGDRSIAFSNASNFLLMLRNTQALPFQQLIRHHEACHQLATSILIDWKRA